MSLLPTTNNLIIGGIIPANLNEPPLQNILVANFDRLTLDQRTQFTAAILQTGLLQDETRRVINSASEVLDA